MRLKIHNTETTLKVYAPDDSLEDICATLVTDEDFSFLSDFPFPSRPDADIGTPFREGLTLFMNTPATTKPYCHGIGDESYRRGIYCASGRIIHVELIGKKSLIPLPHSIELCGRHRIFYLFEGDIARFREYTSFTPDNLILHAIPVFQDEAELESFLKWCQKREDMLIHLVQKASGGNPFYPGIMTNAYGRACVRILGKHKKQTRRS